MVCWKWLVAPLIHHPEIKYVKAFYDRPLAMATEIRPSGGGRVTDEAPLGESQQDSIRDLLEDNLAARLTTLGLAYREWAITYPQRYQLIFGTPIPGYDAPVEITVPAAAGSLVPLIETIQAIFTAGRLRVDRSAPMTPELKSMLEEWSQFTGGNDSEVLYTALVIWSRVHGLVSMEIGNQLPSFFTDPGEIFRREMKTIENQLLGE